MSSVWEFKTPDVWAFNASICFPIFAFVVFCVFFGAFSSFEAMAQHDVFGLYRRKVHVDPFSTQLVTQSIQGGAHGGFILGQVILYCKNLSTTSLFVGIWTHFVKSRGPFFFKITSNSVPSPSLNRKYAETRQITSRILSETKNEQIRENSQI